MLTSYGQTYHAQIEEKYIDTEVCVSNIHLKRLGKSLYLSITEHWVYFLAQLNNKLMKSLIIFKNEKKMNDKFQLCMKGILNSGNREKEGFYERQAALCEILSLLSQCGFSRSFTFICGCTYKTTSSY